MKHVHLIGIGGTGLSAIALVLLESGYEVSGSDRQFSPQIERLQAAGATVYINHNSKNIKGADLVVRSSAIADDNPEVQSARMSGIPVLKRVDFLEQLTAGKKVIAVAGTHGKTTTSAMITWILVSLGLDPSFVIGSDVHNLGTNAHAGKGIYFVIEADEYDRMFLGLKPQIAIVTNIEHDHPDCYPTVADFYQAFQEFANRIVKDGVLIVCSDNPGAKRLADDQEGSLVTLSYAIDNQTSDYLAQDLKQNNTGGFVFRFAQVNSTPDHQTEQMLVSKKEISLRIPGKHNVSNALAALVVVDYLDLSIDDAATALGGFQGTARRFDIRGSSGDVIVIDDYAHHPTEIRATLAAARDSFPDQMIWVVWQPHTYSRTSALAAEFARAFGDPNDSPVNRVIVTEIYAARETPPAKGYSAAEVVRMIHHPAVQFIPQLDQVAGFLLEVLKPGDILLVLSAGDADQVSSAVLKGLEIRQTSWTNSNSVISQGSK
jgi:UDP-N-acetylmuramate--alanine ligase